MTIALTPMNTRYRPLTQIGRGAMAEVVLAEMQLAGGVTGLAALKRLWPALADDPELVSMFLREGRLCERMNHPNVVRTYEVVERLEGASIAMEYLEGQTLARVLNRMVDSGALDLAARLGVLVDVLAGLDYVHELRDVQGTAHGIVHRDVNPQNVFVTYDGVVKVMDFGVAKAATDPYQTRPGALRGKLAYLAPEQALGERVDRRADIFSVGVMLWELVTGRRMWQAMTEASIMRRLAAGGLPSLPWDPAVPAALAKVCSRALAREPAARFPTARAFAVELRRVMPEVGAYQRRQLGSVVALAFAPERAARRTLIEEHLRLARGTFSGGGAARSEEHLAPPLHRERSTPRTAWSIEAPPWSSRLNEAAPCADDEPTEVIEPDVISEAAASPGPASLPTSMVAPVPFRRARWMAVGFAMAVLIGACAIGAGVARSGAGDERARTRTAEAPVAAAAPPTIVVPLATVPLATVPFDLKHDPKDEAVAAAPEPDPVVEPLDPHRQRMRTRPVRTTDVAHQTARAGAGDRQSGAGRPAPLDDEVLEPTINLKGTTLTRGPRGTATPDPARPPTLAVPAAALVARRSAVKVLDPADPFVP